MKALSLIIGLVLSIYTSVSSAATVKRYCAETAMEISNTSYPSSVRFVGSDRNPELTQSGFDEVFEDYQLIKTDGGKVCVRFIVKADTKECKMQYFGGCVK